MSSISKVEDLIKLIETEKVSPDKIDPNRSFKFFCHCLIKSIVEIYLKFQNFEGINIHEAVMSGINLVYHIFWILISYTNNLKLSVFLLERAILLNIEFISMSRNPVIDRESFYLPNVNDAIIFAYRKTLGPIKGFLHFNPKLEKVKTASLDLKSVIGNIFFKIVKNLDLKKDEWETDDVDYKKVLENKLEESISFIYTSLLNLHNLEPPFDLQRSFFLMIKQFIDSHLDEDNGLRSSLILIRYTLDQMIIDYKVSKHWDNAKITMENQYFNLEKDYPKYLEIIKSQKINYYSKNKKISIYFRKLGQK